MKHLCIFLCVLLLLAVGGGTPAQAEDEFSVTFIDVGKGDCILIECGGHFALIDAGYAYSSNGVIGYLAGRGVKQLDAMIITHFDKDHVGGASDVADVFMPAALYLPDYEGYSKYYGALMNSVSTFGLNVLRVSERVFFALGEAKISVYPSGVAYDAFAGDEGNDNDVSLLTELTMGKDSYFFAGEIEQEGIDAYLRNSHGQFDVLKVPHHGKKESNSQEFIASFGPRIAVITDSVDDTAAMKILKWLEAADVETFQTSACGTITIKSRGTGEYEVEFDPMTRFG